MLILFGVLMNDLIYAADIGEIKYDMIQNTIIFFNNHNQR